MAGDREVPALREARDRVLERIAQAAGRAGRNPDDVTLVAVSKLVPAERLRAAVAAGLTLLGENRVQEAATKHDAVAGARWHLVGPLQSNKARLAVELFEAIESVDSIPLADRLDRLVRELRPASALTVYLQVNVDRDPTKAGFEPEAVEPALTAIEGLPGIRLAGLMTVGRVVPDPEGARPTFRALRELSGALTASHPALGDGLSMGMSDDFEIAVEEGATVVRVGRALFGERPDAAP